MASLAPGNGWFPQRTYDARRSVYAVRKLATNPEDNVYEFPSVGPAVAPQTQAGGSVIGKAAAFLVAEAAHAGRSGAWVLAWCIFALALTPIVWLGLVGALFAAAITFGVPWTTAAIAVGTAHLLAAALAVLVISRIGKSIA